MLALQRTAGNRVTARALARGSRSQRRLQRFQQTVHPYLGTSSDPSNLLIIAWGRVTAVTRTGPRSPLSQPDFAASASPIRLDEDVTGGLAQFHIFYGWEIVNVLVNDHGCGSWDASVPYTVVGDQIVYGPPIVATHDTGGTAGVFDVDTSSGPTNGGGYVAVTARLTSSTSSAFGGGITFAPEGVGAEASAGTQSDASNSFARSFVINLRLADPQPTAGPRLTFAVGQAQLEDGQEAALSAWFLALPEATRTAISTGRRSINIAGYASTTARRRRNRDLSEQRARVVERILRGLAGSDADLNLFFLGEDATEGPDNYEAAEERCATVEVGAPSAPPAPPAP